MRTTYLQKVRQHSKVTYYLMLLFILSTMGLNLIRMQITPVYVWSMYSQKVIEPESYAVYTLQYNSKELNLPVWNDHKRMFFYYTIPFYEQCRNNGDVDPAQEKVQQKFAALNIPFKSVSSAFSTKSEVRSYPLWLKRYMESNLEEKITRMSAKKIDLVYLESGRLAINQTAELFNFGNSE